MTIKIGIHGASGRMGLAVEEAIAKDSRFYLAAKYSRSYEFSTLLDLVLSSDVIIDFSSPEGLFPLLEIAKTYHKKILIGTTGLLEQHFHQIEKAAQVIAVLHAPNTSIGANLLIEMAGKMAKVLSGYDAEIIDLHHQYKKDAPSGTALAIGKNIALAKEQKFENVAVFNRVNKGERQNDEIGFSSIRAGGIWGEHEVIFANSSEVITLGARALSRDVFADGALTAAHWLNSKGPGLYTMKEVLEI